MSILNKKEAIEELIKTIYCSNSDLILSEEKIKKLNNFFKEAKQFDEEFDKYFDKHSMLMSI